SLNLIRPLASLSTRPEIQLVFQELKLVLIGGQGAGKNMIGNSILEKKVFTFWTSTSMRRTSYISKTRTVSGTQIHLTRIPGWKGDLSRSEKTKREIVCCVQSLYRNRPHAVLLALKVNSVLSESNIRTLESLQLWDHTIIVFTHADKLGDHSIEDYIRRVQLQHLIDKCGGRYYVFQKNYSNQINKIKELVFDKISANVNKLLKSKDAEIEKLHNIIKEKNWEIETLRYSRDQNLKWIEKLQHQLDMTSKELKTKPIFEDLKLVLIGSQGAGKNTIANAILKEKVFTFWTSLRSVHIKETRTVSGTQIHLARTPGWNGDLSRSEQTKREIVHCVQTLYKTGPHAVILVLNVNSVLSESNISTLESLLTVQLWDHTIVLFTNGEKLRHYSIEDHIRSEQLQPLIDKCGKRYFVIRKNYSNQIIETIEEHVVRKNSMSCFKLSAQTDDNNTLLLDLKYVVERIKSKISSLSASKEKLQNEDSMKKVLDAKEAEIRRLEKIVQEKEREIERLQSRTQDLDQSAQNRRNTELEDQVYMMSNELKGMNTENETLKKQVKEKDAEIEKLKKELQVRRQEAVGQWTQENQYATVCADYCSKLCQGVSAGAIRSQTQIQLQAIPSKGKYKDSLFVMLNYD
uniref:AIG1-type G domain-containing protein n=1 Tax=Sinocyclocheilus grahami TaxID=75366 RepID=A0A672RBH1_SINGR